MSQCDKEHIQNKDLMKTSIAHVLSLEHRLVVIATTDTMLLCWSLLFKYVQHVQLVHRY